MDDLLSEFLDETDELIEVLLADLQTLRARRGQGSARRDLIGRIFRHIHTIKGSASALDLEATINLAHELESLLDEARMGRIAPDDAMIEALDDGAAAISTLVEAARRGETPPIPEVLIERIRRIAGRESSPVAPSNSESVLALLPDDVARSLSQYELVRLRESIEEGARLFIVNVSFALETFDERFRELSAELTANGDLVSTMPGIDPASLDQISFRLVYSTKLSSDDLSRRLERYADLTLNELSPVTETPKPSPISDVDPSGEPAVERVSLVRVDLHELDDVVAATHELATDTALALTAALASEMSRNQRTDLELSAARIRRRFAVLEEQLIGLRMVSVDQTMSRVIRAGMMAARSSGKEIEFSKQGEDVQIDKSLADGLYEPLLHLVRNAVDHGIETPAQRRAAGKAGRGSIRLEAESAGSRIRMRLIDDGRGIDAAAVRQKAVERGLVEAASSMSEHQILRMIFQPGFSTAAAVSELSGRGVGLDVVESMVARVGGEVHLSSNFETGTSFELVLPTTLALVSTLVVKSNGSPYSLAANHITEAGYMATESIRSGPRGAAIIWRGEKLPFVNLRALLAQPERPAEPRQHLVIARRSEGPAQVDDETAHQELVAVGVDSWEGHREILVRSLGKQSTHWRGISGAAELPTGEVALVLDLPRLLGAAF